MVRYDLSSTTSNTHPKIELRLYYITDIVTIFTVAKSEQRSTHEDLGWKK